MEDIINSNDQRKVMNKIYNYHYIRKKERGEILPKFFSQNSKQTKRSNTSSGFPPSSIYHLSSPYSGIYNSPKNEEYLSQLKGSTSPNNTFFITENDVDYSEGFPPSSYTSNSSRIKKYKVPTYLPLNSPSYDHHQISSRTSSPYSLVRYENNQLKKKKKSNLITQKFQQKNHLEYEGKKPPTPSLLFNNFQTPRSLHSVIFLFLAISRLSVICDQMREYQEKNNIRRISEGKTTEILKSAGEYNSISTKRKIVNSFKVLSRFLFSLK
jgi:hypothetical protein